jgi:hypothetical protein
VRAYWIFFWMFLSIFLTHSLQGSLARAFGFQEPSFLFPVVLSVNF